MYLTVVGSRKADFTTLETIAQISLRTRCYGITTRTGDAIGVDHSCRSFSSYRASRNPTLVNNDEFTSNYHISKTEVYSYRDYENSDLDSKIKIESIVSNYHGAWHRCSPYAKGLHCRNLFQVIGPDVFNAVPSFAILCWTPDGCEHHSSRSILTGGTGTVISLASMEYNIPVFNIQREGRLQEFYEFMRTIVRDNNL